MAMKLPISLASGVNAEYWKVIGIRIDVIANTATAMVNLYLDQTSKDAGKVPVKYQEYNMSGGFASSDLDKANPIAIAYAKLKALPDFSRAIDVLEAGQVIK